MSYTVVTNSGSIVVADGTTNSTSLDLTLVGKNYSGYGSIFNQNYVKLLENFASASEPLHPTTGQVWYDTGNKLPKVYTGTSWKNIGSATAAPTEPSSPNQGDLWYDTTNKQLRAYNTTSWDLIGPDYTASQLVSGQVITSVSDGAASYVVVQIWIAGELVGIISKTTEFTPSPSISGFTTIKPGLNFSSGLAGVKSADSDLLDGLDSTQFMRTDTNTSTSGNLSITSATVSSSTSTGALKVSGGAGIVGNLYAGNVSATGLAGTLSTAAQPNITSVGTLTSLSITGNVSAANMASGGNISALDISTTTLGVSGQSQLHAVIATSLGLGSGNLTTTGNITGSTVTGTTLVGTVSTSAQGSITSLGSLTGLTVAGTLYGQTITTASGNLTLSANSGRITATSAITISDSTASVNTTTGALVVAGGTGINGNLHAGSLYTDNYFYANGDPFGTPSGTVASGTATRLAFYAGTAAAVSDVAGLTWTTGPNTLTVTGKLIVTGSITTTDDMGITGNLVTTGSLSVGNITAASNNINDIGTSGTKFANVYATTFYGVTTASQYADLAEIYDTDEDYAVGTVMVVGGAREVTACTSVRDVTVVGVISEKPGLLMNEGSRGQPVALRGKVPVLVTGAISRGDLIVSSMCRGCGESAGNDPDFKSVSFAIAIESNDSTDIKTVMALIL